GAQGQGEALLQVGIVLELQPLARLGEEIDDVAHRRVLQVAEQHRVAEHEVVDVPVRIGREDRAAAAALEIDGVFAWLVDPAPGDDGNAIGIGHDCTCRDYAWDTKSMKSLYACAVPAQLILSSPPSISAKRVMTGPTRGPFQPQGQSSSQ